MKHKKHMKRCLILFAKEMQFTDILDKNLQNHFAHIRGSTYKSWQSPDYQVSGWTVLLSCWLVSVWNDIFLKQARQFPRIHHNHNTLILWLSHPTSGNLSYRETYKHDKPRHCIKKQRHYFGNKCPYSQSYGFSSSQVWMWELDHKEGWAPKNWCFWTVVLEKTLDSPLDCKEI